jgi:hypothetical protein
MRAKLEKLIKHAYKEWSADQVNSQEHPDEETFACFLDGRLDPQESQQVKLHLINCDSCCENIAVQLNLKPIEDRQIPSEILEKIKGLVKHQEKCLVMEIFLKIKENAMELINTTGDVLVDMELVPAPVLRSRSIKDFKEEVTILKDFNDVRVEVKIESRKTKDFNVLIVVKKRETQGLLKDLRVTLLKDDVELESYLTDSGLVTFEHISLGKYSVEISSSDNKLAVVLLDVKV